MSWAELYTAIFNTLVVATGVLFISIPIATGLSIAMVRTNMFGARWAWFILFSQWVVPLYALVGAWSAGFGTQGWWPLSPVTLAGKPAAGLAAVIFVHAMSAIPSNVFILTLGLYWTRRSREELALVDGGNRNVVRRVLLPELRGWLAAAALWSLVPVLTEMVVTNLFQVPTLPEQVYLDISLGTDTPRTYLVSILLCTLPLLLVAWWLRRQLPELSSLATQMAQHAPRPLQLRSWRLPISLIVWVTVAGIVVVPTCNLLIKAGWESMLQPSGGLTHRWTFQRLLKTAIETTTLFTNEFQWTATLALASSISALFLASGMRWWVYWSGRAGWRHFFNFLCLILIALPGPLVATLMTWLFLNVPGLGWCYDNTLLAPIVAQQSRLLPLGWLLVGGILSTVSQSAWELGQVDQLSAWLRWRTLIWRPTRGLWLLAWLILAATSAGELSTHLLLLPPGVTTVAQRLFELLHFGMRYQDSGLCLAMVAIGWLVAIVVWKTREGRV
ncbi:MAG: iron ABC transporter permease [Pirellulaceae bacterium]|nr:iron ABC transporter permease [Pirellulaceae bacterium]